MCQYAFCRLIYLSDFPLIWPEDVFNRVSMLTQERATRVKLETRDRQSDSFA